MADWHFMFISQKLLYSYTMTLRLIVDFHWLRGNSLKRYDNDTTK